MVLPPILNELAALGWDALLVLDDYHVLQSTAAHGMLRFLLQHLPPPLHLVIISREDPPLPLAAMRGRGGLSIQPS
jgi:LuxR family maltose regulon positive regulatory protein